MMSTADMVVQRRDGPRRLREIDDDDFNDGPRIQLIMRDHRIECSWSLTELSLSYCARLLPNFIFTARRYASAVYTVVVCPSIPTMVEFVDDTCTTVDESWLCLGYYKSVNCSPLTQLLRFVVDLLYTTCFYGRQDFDWHSAFAVAELLAKIVKKVR